MNSTRMALVDIWDLTQIPGKRHAISLSEFASMQSSGAGRTNKLCVVYVNPAQRAFGLGLLNQERRSPFLLVARCRQRGAVHCPKLPWCSKLRVVPHQNEPCRGQRPKQTEVRFDIRSRVRSWTSSETNHGAHYQKYTEMASTSVTSSTAVRLLHSSFLLPSQNQQTGARIDTHDLCMCESSCCRTHNEGSSIKRHCHTTKTKYTVLFYGLWSAAAQVA